MGWWHGCGCGFEGVTVTVVVNGMSRCPAWGVMVSVEPGGVLAVTSG